MGHFARTPYLGLGLETEPAGHLRVAEVEPRSTAARALLQTGDILIAVGEVQSEWVAESAGEAGRVFQLRVKDRYRAGSEATWLVDRDGERLSLSAPFVAPPAAFFVTQVIVVGVFWAIAFFLLWTRSDQRVVRHLAYTVLAMTAGYFFQPATDLSLREPLTLALQELSSVGRFLAPALVVHFGLIFARQTLGKGARRAVLGAGYGVPLLLFLVEQWVIVSGARDPEAPYLIYGGVLDALRYGEIRFWVYVGCFLAAGALIVQTYRHLVTRPERDQVKWVLWGIFFVAATEGLLVCIALYARGRYSYELLQPYLNLIYLLVAGALLAGIMRHDPFDVDRTIRKSATCLGTTGLVFAFFAVAEEMLSATLGSILPGEPGLLPTAVSAVLAAALFEPVRRLIDRLLGAVAPSVRAPSRLPRKPSELDLQRRRAAQEEGAEPHRRRRCAPGPFCSATPPSPEPSCASCSAPFALRSTARARRCGCAGRRRREIRGRSRVRRRA